MPERTIAGGDELRLDHRPGAGGVLLDDGEELVVLLLLVRVMYGVAAADSGRGGGRRRTASARSPLGGRLGRAGVALDRAGDDLVRARRPGPARPRSPGHREPIRRPAGDMTGSRRVRLGARAVASGPPSHAGQALRHYRGGRLGGCGRRVGSRVSSGRKLACRRVLAPVALGVVHRPLRGVEEHLGGLVEDPEPAVGRVESGDRRAPRRTDLVRRAVGSTSSTSYQLAFTRTSPSGSRRPAICRRSCRASPAAGTARARRSRPACPSCSARSG